VSPRCYFQCSSVQDEKLMEQYRGALFLNSSAGADFIERLWKETLQDVSAVDPGLKTVA